MYQLLFMQYKKETGVQFKLYAISKKVNKQVLQNVVHIKRAY